MGLAGSWMKQGAHRTAGGQLHSPAWRPFHAAAPQASLLVLPACVDAAPALPAALGLLVGAAAPPLPQTDPHASGAHPW
eukprot:scaffold97779_cov18-Tisochrysis_lutea.AAC.1